MSRKFIYLLTTLLCLPLLSNAQGSCGRIGLIGEHTAWMSDVFLTRNSENPDMFAGIITLADMGDAPNDTVEVKFRQNADWAVNWGGVGMSGTAELNAGNIMLDPGTYLVSFNCASAEYSFEATCGSIGLIGEHTAWTSDVVMTRDAENINLFTAAVTLTEDPSIEEPNDTVELKFRENGDWAVNWGGEGFPSDTAVGNGANILVPAGSYLVSFDCLTGVYSFTATCGSVGIIGEMTEWSSDINMTRNAGDPNEWSAILAFNANTLGAEDGFIELKFRENADWAVNWGDTIFPSGIALANGGNIKVPIDTNAAATTYLVTFNCSTGAYNFAPTCGEVSMIGEFINWAGDVPMNRDAVNPNLWRLTHSFATPFDANADGKIEGKFRQNADWAVNWGGEAFPSGSTTDNGPNIPIVPGATYDITFDCSTGEYSFTENTDVCGQIGLIGAFNEFGVNADPAGIPTDVLMIRDPNQPSTFRLNYNFTASTTLLFRQDADLAFADVWGGTSFPEGTGIKDPSQFINVTGGKYDITFNCKSGDYSFTRLGNSVIAPKVFAITLDGNLNENDWNLDQPVSRIVDGEAGDDPNMVSFGLTHNDEHLFVGVQVTDGDVVATGDALDRVQIFLDGDKSGGDYDAADIHLVIDAAGGVTVVNGPEAVPMGFVQMTDNGYNVEAAISWADLGVMPGSAMSFDLAVNDVDAGNQSMMVWNGGVGNADNTSAFGDLIFGALKCGNISVYSENIGDVRLLPITDDVSKYVGTYMFEGDESVVFRKDNQSSVTWGAEDFPGGTAIIGGAQIPVTAGRYRVSFGCLDGTYSFTEESSDAVALANYAETEATIDGDLGEYSLDYGLDAGVIDGAGPLNNTVAWGLNWDAEYLYMGAQVDDEVVMGSLNLNPWQQDAIEIYFDGNHDEDGTYDGEFDTQIILSYRMTEGDPMWVKADGVPITADDFEAVFVITDDGYNVEMKLKWSVFGFSAAKNRSIGFTLGINDTDANATDREYQAAWAGDANNWNNTAVFGDIQLAGGPLTSSVQPLFNSSVVVMPNPTSGNLFVRAADGIFVGQTQLFITNMMGQTLLNQQIQFNHKYGQAEINIGSLVPGIYLLNMVSEEGKRAVKKIVKE